MNLSEKERAVVERMRAAERKKRGTVPCYDCAGTGSYSQSDCETCKGSGELKRNGPEIQARVRRLEAQRAEQNVTYDSLIAQAKGEPPPRKRATRAPSMPKCSCGQQSSNPNCKRRKAGYPCDE